MTLIKQNNHPQYCLKGYHLDGVPCPSTSKEVQMLLLRSSTDALFAQEWAAANENSAADMGTETLTVGVLCLSDAMTTPRSCQYHDLEHLTDVEQLQLANPYLCYLTLDMEALKLELLLDDQIAEYHVQTIFIQPVQVEGDNLPSEVGTAIAALWKDQGVLDYFKRSREYQFNDYARYYFDSVDRIVHDYMPAKFGNQ